MTGLEHRSLQSCQALLAWACRAEENGGCTVSLGFENPEDATDFRQPQLYFLRRVSGGATDLHT